MVSDMHVFIPKVIFFFNSQPCAFHMQINSCKYGKEIVERRYDI